MVGQAVRRLVVRFLVTSFLWEGEGGGGVDLQRILGLYRNIITSHG